MDTTKDGANCQYGSVLLGSTFSSVPPCIFIRDSTWSSPSRSTYLYSVRDSYCSTQLPSDSYKQAQSPTNLLRMSTPVRSRQGGNVTEPGKRVSKFPAPGVPRSALIKKSTFQGHWPSLLLPIPTPVGIARYHVKTCENFCGAAPRHVVWKPQRGCLTKWCTCQNAQELPQRARFWIFTIYTACAHLIFSLLFVSIIRLGLGR